MNREIKFRGHNGVKWLYGSEISIIPAFDEKHCFMPNYENKLDQDYVPNWDSVCYVGEYTEIKDIEGNEIYEGDIVEINSMYPGEDEKFIGVVEMIEGCWCIANDKKQIAKYLYSETDVNHVIGNIYDNPGLLEG